MLKVKASLTLYTSYNLGQRIVDKSTKLSKKKGFSIECFTADFSRFSILKVKICHLRFRMGTRHQTQAFLGFS